METIDNPGPPPGRQIGLYQVVAINFGIMLIYMLLTGFLATADKVSSHGLLEDALLLAAQTVLNLMGGLALFFTRHRSVAKGLLLSALLVPVIGFGICVSKESFF